MFREIMTGVEFFICSVRREKQMKQLVPLIFATYAGISTSALAICPGGQTGKIASNVSVMNLQGKVFFRTLGLELDFDGNPRAYGVRDQGEEGICNGVAPIAVPCHGRYDGACFKVCEDTFAEWSRVSGDPGTLSETMCSVGLGGGGCSRPDVRLQEAPNQAWFVSETSLKTSPATGPLSAEWLRGQAAQLDPAGVRQWLICT